MRWRVAVIRKLGFVAVIAISIVIGYCIVGIIEVCR
jgi:hypothetical protein